MTSRTLGELWSRYFRERGRWYVLRSAQVGGTRGEGSQGQAGGQLLAPGQVRRGKNSRARLGTSGSGRPRRLRPGRASRRRRNLRSGAKDQVRVVRHFEDPLVHPGRAEEG